MKWQYWQHNTSGEIYAVGISSIIDEDHQSAQVIDACGPLHYSEVTKENLRDGNFNGDPELAEWIRQNENSFHVKEQER